MDLARLDINSYVGDKETATIKQNIGKPEKRIEITWFAGEGVAW